MREHARAKAAEKVRAERMMAPAPLIVKRPEGLYCPAGGFYIDPWRAVDKAVITHAHADHARTGHRAYLCATQGEGVLRARLGPITLQTLAYGQQLAIGDVTVSLHPAGHVLGSAQVRVAHRGEVWVVSGDYKVEPDITCEAFEPVPCHCFITECTFGLPIYQWRPTREVMGDINRWWRDNAEQGRPSVLLGYSFGKSQRILAELDASIGPIATHTAMVPMNQAYRQAGIKLPDTQSWGQLGDLGHDHAWSRALLMLPPGATRGLTGSAASALKSAHIGMASGWMQLRSHRKRAGVDRGFVLSDHADWPGLLQAIDATGAERIIVTHGQEDALVHWLQSRGVQASTASDIDQHSV